MKYIKTYETNIEIGSLDFVNFVKKIYLFFKKTYNKKFELLKNDKSYSIITNIDNNKIYITEIEFKHVNKMEILIWNNISIFDDDLKIKDIIDYYKHIINHYTKEHNKIKYMNFKSYTIITKKQMNNILNELTKEKLDLFTSTNKYNL